MRKKVSIDRFIPLAPLPSELRPDWLSSAAPLDRAGCDGNAAERSLSIAS
ncbi:hypothetical protein [Pseudaminobacter sp. NGMCC 1.201702]